MRELTALQNFVLSSGNLSFWQQPRSQGCGKMRDPGNEVVMAAKKTDLTVKKGIL